jgi:hypothetical protein
MPPIPRHLRSRRQTAPRAGSAQPRWREVGPSPARCQAMGGARAWKRALRDAAKPNATAAASRTWPNILGSGKGGVSAGTNAPARWISVQIGQQSSARSSRPAGLEGALTSSPGGCALASAVAPAEAGAIYSECTCPNETASWNVSASNAKYEPNLERDRNQPIIITLRASHTRQRQCLADNFSYNVTLRQSGSRDSSDVLPENISCGHGRVRGFSGIRKISKTKG